MSLTLQYRLTTIKHQLWTRYFVAMAILNMYAVHNSNGLDAYTLYTVHEQDSVVARHEKTHYVYACYCLCAIQYIT